MIDWHDCNDIYAKPQILLKYSIEQLKEMVSECKNALIFKRIRFLTIRAFF